MTATEPADPERFDAGIRAHASHATRITNARRFALVALAAAIVLLIAAGIAWFSR